MSSFTFGQWFAVSKLPKSTRMGTEGAHGDVVLIGDLHGPDECKTVAKVIKKQKYSVTTEFYMELLAREYCCRSLDQSTGQSEDILTANNIVPITAVYETPKKYAIIMPYLKDGDLWAYLNDYIDGDAAQLTIGQCANIINDMLIAVQCMHAHGIANRDIKDANVLLKPDCNGSMLCDMSLATPSKHNINDHFVPYTLGYRAPEVVYFSKAFNNTIDWFAADIYACGVVMLRMLLVLSGVWKESTAPPKSLLTDTDCAWLGPNGPKLKSLILGAMSDDAASRPKAHELLYGLSQCDFGVSIGIAPFTSSKSLLPIMGCHDRSVESTHYGIWKMVKEQDFPWHIGKIAAAVFDTIPMEFKSMPADLLSLLCMAFVARIFLSMDEQSSIEVYCGWSPHTSKQKMNTAVFYLQSSIETLTRSSNTLKSCVFSL